MTIQHNTNQAPESSTAVKERRRRRAKTPTEAMTFQLRHVADILSLDAIVLADDLGMPIASAGDPAITRMLADSAMWSAFSEDAVDEVSLETLRESRPDVEREHLSCRTVSIESQKFSLLACGRSTGRHIGMEHAATGVERIARTFQA